MQHVLHHPQAPGRNTKSKIAAKPSRILDAVHDSAADLHDLGFIDARRMKAYDALMPATIEPFTVNRIRLLRQKLNISQTVFAALLNTSESTVKKWEAGDKSPSGPSLKLLDLAERKEMEVLL